MESKVEELVSDKRILLVLDDVWDGGIWEDNLEYLLQGSAMNSRLLITTRKEEVSRRMGSFETYKKKRLSPDEGWRILRTALEDSITQERLQNFRMVGMEIVDKCGGLPLAVKVVRGVLKSKGSPRIEDWKTVRDNPSWKQPRDERESLQELIPALYLSYADLPPNLKQCFIYCSLFPEDFKFHKPNLAQMWVAEGFVRPAGSRAKEDVALEYFTQLMNRSLLQELPGYFEDWGATMHDAVRDLAVHVSTKKYQFQQGSRHWTLLRKDAKEAPSLNDMRKHVRTLLLSRNPSITCLPKNYFGKLRRLRVLDLSYTGIESLDDSIGKLVQLRFLNISYTKLKGIPDSIQNLRNLQTLHSYGCKFLKRLPNGMSQLVNLTDLRVDPADGQLDQMPVGMGNLVNLRTLRGFVANDQTQGENNMKDLEGLTQLRDLAVYKLEAVTSRAKAQEACLKNKQKLNKLQLSCNPRKDLDREDPEIKRIEKVFQGLSPPSMLEILHIEKFFGKRLPDWISNDSLSNLRWLRLENCKFCRELPPLGKLSELRVLHIWSLSSISAIGAECFGGETEVRSSLPSLETLYFRGMSKWKLWSGLGCGALPVLNSLHIAKCPKLRSLPDGLCHATSLRQLQIDGADKLKVIKDLPSVTELKISNNQNLEEISNLTQLKTMDICNCPSITQTNFLDVLAHLKLVDSKIDILPVWLTRTTSLQRLELVCSVDLLKRCCLADSEDWCKISNVPRIEARSHEGSKYISYVKHPHSFESN
ncbi:unnamed protein product [Spirodela intermedia]|nr:unnamed protein product [Spirodela intermedia]CAA6661051.1 unnamed protein product [Spirodela intermedia]